MCWQIRMITLLVTAFVSMASVAAVSAADMSIDQCEHFVLSEINRVRAEQGLSQLRLNHKLRAMARSHSTDMAENGSLSHTDSLGRDFRDRLGTKFVERYHAGENVSTNNFPDSARVAVAGWRQSPKHLKNILNDKFTETGVGVAINSEGLVFFTQIFLGR